ncbi:carbohydrate ABC transporter permease [Demequina lutea]|uniref:Multiple sugar transport system permease protein/alpha-1,4-digalacturonate transport system permease protein n=1 Tax=Demequina lutea TaxID=431489 RepID=A0A7Y9ZB74_9MICO|nr:sugar ABC transporter permease [Demequina lutea]NYI42177.1 multiple sugar transport system permease protein/alpha-1,4-digalacturonate transport system permease protein [Demequina lutea]
MSTMTTEGPTRSRRTLKLRNTLTSWSFILPNFLGFGAITLLPVILLFYISFTKWNVFGKATWIGTANFTRLLHDASFHKALINTLYYSALHIPLTLVISLSMALLLNTKMRGVTFFRTAAFFPFITSIVAISAVWNMLYSPDYGVINQVLRSVGIDNPPGWTNSSTWAMPALIIVSVWRDAGYYMLLFLAGLQTVPRDLYEAARTDGANAWQRFVNVTLPCLRPTTFFITVILTIGSLKIFDLVLVMTNGGPGQATTVLSQFIYKKGFLENDYGYASSAAVVLFLISIGITVVQFVVNKKRDES